MDRSRFCARLQLLNFSILRMSFAMDFELALDEIEALNQEAHDAAFYGSSGAACEGAEGCRATNVNATAARKHSQNKAPESSSDHFSQRRPLKKSFLHKGQLQQAIKPQPPNKVSATVPAQASHRSAWEPLDVETTSAVPLESRAALAEEISESSH